MSETTTASSDSSAQATREIADVPAVEVVTTVAVHLMSAAAVKCGLSDDDDAQDQVDLAEARILITALAGLVNSWPPYSEVPMPGHCAMGYRVCRPHSVRHHPSQICQAKAPARFSSPRLSG